MPTATSNFTELTREVDVELGLLTREEAADYAGVSVATIIRWNQRGYLPVVRLGRAVRVAETDLRKLVTERDGEAKGRLRRVPPGPKPQGSDQPGAVTITLTAEQVAQVAALLRVVEGAAK